MNEFFNDFGLVLAGGGAKGAYQMGVVKAMEEFGILPNVKGISGTSIGGINLSIVAGSSPSKGYEAWQSFKGMDFIEFDDNGFDITKYGDGLFTRESLLKIVDDNVDYQSIIDKDIPCFVTVGFKDFTGMNKAKYAKLNGLDRDTIRKYLLATSAIPIVYDAVDIEGTLYFDGGLIDNTPIMPLYGEGITNILVVSNDSEYKSKANDFPGANIIDIVPSATLDMDTLIGTADLKETHAIYRLRLGYYDAKAIISAILENRPIPDLKGNSVLAKSEMKMKELDLQTKSNINGLENMLSKYGIKL